MFVRHFVLSGLGHLSTLIGDEGTRTAAVIDPRRDVDAYLTVANEHGLRITHAVETHLHNDYVSGGRELATATGAQQVIGAGAELRYPHRPIRHGEEFSVGRLRFTALDTPGHTPEHVAYTVADTTRAEAPVVMFTGGSLLVGSVGRTDLLGPENAIPFGRAMFRSLHEVILAHEDFVGVMPTHGAGSLCSTGISSTPSSSIGYERRYNALLSIEDADRFAHALLAGQPAFPRYFARMRPTNQGGPRVLGGVPEPQALSVDAVREALAAGALVIDTRAPHKHSAGHIPRSLSIALDGSFGTWLGWVVTDPDRPLILLLADPSDWDEAIRQAIRIGFDAVIGFLDGGFAAWQQAGLEVETGHALTVDGLAVRLRAGGSEAPLVIDVRQATEYLAGHLAGSVPIGAGALPDVLDQLPRDRPIATICASGYRASVAASLLRAAGFERVEWVRGGVPSWADRGYPVEVGGPEPEPSDVEASRVAMAAPAEAHRH
jgi:hydroxyacylglutathione hydrolase